MEKLLKVLSQSPLKETTWENRNHEQVLISSVEFEMTDGIDSFLAEANGDLAKMVNQSPLQLNKWYPMSLKSTIGSWTKQDGSIAKTNRIRILKIGIPLF